MTIRVLCRDYVPSQPFIEAGCGYWYDGSWQIEIPQQLQCPGCGAVLDQFYVATTISSLEEQPVAAVASGGHVFNFSRRPLAPYFFPEDGEATA